MTEVIVSIPQAKEVVSQIYELGARLAESPSSILYVGRLTGQRETRLISVGKTRFNVMEERARHFADRTAALNSYFARHPSQGAMLRGELDADGVPFFELIRIQGDLYPIVRRSQAEADRRFMSLIRSVGSFHAAGIWFGDLTPSSFIADSFLEPVIVGLMGLTGPLVLASDEINQAFYLAPEVRRGQPASPASDVFSLSVLGAVLFGLTFQPREVIRAVEVRGRLEREGVPEWLRDIICQGLAPSPGDRPSDAVRLLEIVQSAREGRISGPLVPREAQAFSVANRTSQLTTEPQTVAPIAAGQTPGDTRNVGKLIIGSGIFGVLLLAFIFFRHGISTVSNEEKTAGQVMALLGQAGFSPKMTPLERSQFFERLNRTTDPTVHDAVILVIDRAESAEERLAAERWLLDRCDRLGMHRSVSVIRRWFGDKPLVRPRGFLAALRALDRSAPQGAHEKNIQEVAISERGVAVQLAVALLMDWGGREVDRRTLSSLVAGVPGNKDILERPITAIVLALSETRRSFPDDTREGLLSLGGSDLLWLLSRVIREQDEEALPAIVSAVLASPDLGARQRKLLELGVSDKDVPTQIRLASVRLAGRAFLKEDLDALAAWRDVRSAGILLLITQVQSDDQVVRGILNTLFGKSVDSEPAQSMLGILKRASEADLIAAGRVPGYFYELSENDELRDAVDVKLVRTMASMPDMLKAVMNSECERCQEVVVDTAPEKLSPSMLFRLLGAKTGGLRVKALRRLAQYEDVGAVNLLRLNYEREKDETVREVYRSSFPRVFAPAEISVAR